ncbi:uncharacterized protein LOC141852784 isoform X2 [Brevipalpus obovatus]|uniref:uncharacterized protein LOC141852784 isoform X2 n=1 Tax=Brevipalpus obovatus TaxID=246614 RepID=UPI003D9E894F
MVKKSLAHTVHLLCTILILNQIQFLTSLDINTDRQYIRASDRLILDSDNDSGDDFSADNQEDLDERFENLLKSFDGFNPLSEFFHPRFLGPSFAPRVLDPRLLGIKDEYPTSYVQDIPSPDRTEKIPTPTKPPPMIIEHVPKEEKKDHVIPPTKKEENNPSIRDFSAKNLRHSPVYLKDSRLSGLSSSRLVDHSKQASLPGVLFIALVTIFTFVGIFSVIGTGYCVYRIRQRKQAADNVDYPAYGICGPQVKPSSGASAPIEPPTGDRKLAQMAQMYHYHHQKQQMMAPDKADISTPRSPSEPESEEENEEGDYTVYECPGLASTGELEVKNPLFQDDSNTDSTPSTQPETTSSSADKQ